LILLFGEAVYRRDIEHYRRYFANDCLFGASLGCNEMDDYSYFFADATSSLPAEVLPGGYIVDDVDVLLLDHNGHPVADGEIGEICVRARYNPSGYWRQDDLTQVAFIDDPGGSARRVYRTGDTGRIEDGCLFHVGRQDWQIKIRGYRVDVAAIEAALLQVAGIKEAAVAESREENGNSRLVAYVVPESTHPVSAAELRQSLRRDLPSYAVPSILMILDMLPLTASGKIDRRRLPQPDRSGLQLQNSFVPPRTPVEEALAQIWADVLGLPEVGVLDNFLELGGDSLRATQVIARVMEHFQVLQHVRALLDAPTVAEMALVILDRKTAPIGDAELGHLLSEMDALSEEEARSLLREPTP
jgi:hypothetical protein